MRTDLMLDALEAGQSEEFARSVESGHLSGVDSKEERFASGKIHIVNVRAEDAAKRLGKPKGTYITIECATMRSPKNDESPADLVETLMNQLQQMIESLGIKEDQSILIVGLGNRNVTPDALGPAVIERILVTGHFFQQFPQWVKPGTRKLFAIAPGVLGTTGMETADIIQGIVREQKPDAIVVIDALATSSLQRLHTSIQMTDQGIRPGSGIANHRKAFDRATFGVPVISIGIPTVVYASSIIREVDEDILLTPKTTDQLIEQGAEWIAEAINRTLHRSLEGTAS